MYSSAVLFAKDINVTNMVLRLSALLVAVPLPFLLNILIKNLINTMKNHICNLLI
jgi:hypothetical protein